MSLVGKTGKKEIVEEYFSKAYGAHDFTAWDLFVPNVEIMIGSLSLHEDEAKEFVSNRIKEHNPTNKYEIKYETETENTLVFSASIVLERDQDGIKVTEYINNIHNSWKFNSENKVLLVHLTLDEDPESQRWSAALQVPASAPYFDDWKEKPTALITEPKNSIQGVGWISPDLFPWRTLLEQNIELIQKEYEELENIPPVVAFKDYNMTLKWRKFPLYFTGVKLKENCKKCPKITELIEKIPGLIGAEFMILEPGGGLPPHNNCLFLEFIRCHIGVVVPPDCCMNVMGETRPWEEGKMFFFDDTLTHNTWNKSNRTRSILSIDVLRPELQGKTTVNEVCLAQFHKYLKYLHSNNKFEFKIDEKGIYSPILPTNSIEISLKSKGDPDPLPGLPAELFWTCLHCFYPNYMPEK